ncbi:MAG TPA: serine/threonine-protein kinase [Candidatus Kapabacteria bacterium]|nr:serine/threonine-protein kinase [Candidatus Kapabacteria bacterium]
MQSYDLNWINSNFPELDRVEILFSGGQKDVFKGYHKQYGAVVLKIIKPSDDQYERTIREIKAANIMESNHVPKVYKTNISDDNHVPIWLLEQYVPGKTLRQLLHEGKKFLLAEIVNFLETLLSISMEAEKKKIVHRDIKPENIILDNIGKYWLIDFGIARHLELSSLTSSSRDFGLFSVGYSAPEQFRNIKKEISIRADIFSIGIVAIEMITGKNPFREKAHSVLDILRNTETFVLPTLKLEGDTQYELAAFIKVLGDKRLSRRPSSAKEAYEMLESVKPTLIF